VLKAAMKRKEPTIPLMPSRSLPGFQNTPNHTKAIAVKAIVLNFIIIG